MSEAKQYDGIRPEVWPTEEEVSTTVVMENLQRLRVARAIRNFEIGIPCVEQPIIKNEDSNMSK